MIGIDLDGTLFSRDGRVSEANVRALAKAREAGMLVVPCTGRAWRESGPAIAAIAPAEGREVGVFVTGAAVTDLASGRGMDLAVIEPHVALRLVGLLHDLPEAVLVCREPMQSGHDYLVTGRGSLTRNTQSWFAATGATVHFQKHVSADDLHHTLRVGIVATDARMREVTATIRAELGAAVAMHHFLALKDLQHDESVYVLEVFAAGVNKWRGMSWVARQHDIAPDQVAFIGDEINDVDAVENAGCGIAMGNAIDAVKNVAQRETRDCDSDGVAHAIEQLLAGKWD